MERGFFQMNGTWWLGIRESVAPAAIVVFARNLRGGSMTITADPASWRAAVELYDSVVENPTSNMQLAQFLDSDLSGC